MQVKTKQKMLIHYLPCTAFSLSNVSLTLQMDNKNQIMLWIELEIYLCKIGGNENMYTLHIKKGFPYFPVTCIAINVDPKHHTEKLHKFVNKSEN